MAYSLEQWEVVKAFYERGFSLGEIIKRDEVEIKNRASICKTAAKEGWIKGNKETFVKKEIKIKQELAQIKEEKETLKETELEIHNKIVSERMRDDIFFRKASHIISRKIIQKVQNEDLSMMELKLAQEGIGKGKENIYGKSPDVAITNTNAQQQAQHITYEIVK